MKKFILGVIVGLALFAFFIFFGGGDYLKKLAVKTDKAGDKIVNYEDEFKRKVKEVKKKGTEVKEKVEAKAKEVKEKVAPE